MGVDGSRRHRGSSGGHGVSELGGGDYVNEDDFITAKVQGVVSANNLPCISNSVRERSPEDVSAPHQSYAQDAPRLGGCSRDLAVAVLVESASTRGTPTVAKPSSFHPYCTARYLTVHSRATFP